MLFDSLLPVAPCYSWSKSLSSESFGRRLAVKCLSCHLLRALNPGRFMGLGHLRMPEYELFYWPITGLGEPIRWQYMRKVRRLEIPVRG